MKNTSSLLMPPLASLALICGALNATPEPSVSANAANASTTEQGTWVYNYGQHAVYSWPIELNGKKHLLGMEGSSSVLLAEPDFIEAATQSEAWHEPSLLPWMPSEWSVENVRGSIGNGTLQIQLTNTRLSVGIPKQRDPGNTPIVVPIMGQLYFSGKVDGQTQLLSTEDFSRIKGHIQNQDGATTLTMEKVLSGGGLGIESVEEIRLHQDLPIFDYSLSLTNTTDQPIDLTLTHGSGAVQVFYAGEFLEGRKVLFVDRQSPREGVLDDKVAWLSVQSRFIKPSAWATVTDDGGYVLGVSTRKEYANLFGAETKWIFPENRMVLDMPAEVEGKNGRPIEVPPGETVETGLTFYLLPQGGNRNIEIGAAFKNLLNERSFDFDSPYTLFNGDTVAAYGSVNGLDQLHTKANLWHVSKGRVDDSSVGLLLEADAAGQGSISVAAQFPDQAIEVHLDVSAMPSDAELTLWSVGANGEKELCGRLNSSGKIARTLQPVAGEAHARRFTLELSGAANAQAKIGYFYVGLPKPAVPELHFPLDDARHIQAGVSFRWGTVPDVLEYQLELSKTPDFETSTRHTINYTAKEALFGRPDRGAPGDAGYFPMDRFEIGQWYWRVAAVGRSGKSPFSEVRSFEVTEMPIKPRARFELSESNFLFCSTLNTGRDAGTLDQLSRAVGPELAENMANRIVLEAVRSLRKESWAELFTSIEQSDDQFMIWPGHSGLDLAVFETALQKCPNIIGFTQGELFWGFWQFPERREFTRRVLELSAAYGAIFIWGDGQEGAYNWLRLAREPKWQDTLNQFGHALVPNWKMNLMTAQYTTQGAILGMELEGLVKNTGVWPENFYWSEAGYGPKVGDYYGKQKGKTKDMPDIFWVQNFLMGLAQGAVTYVNHDATLIHDHKGNPAESWLNVLKPFFQFVNDYPVIPDSETVRRMSRQVSVPPLSEMRYTHDGYGAFQSLYEILYGVEAGREWIDLLPAANSFRPVALLTKPDAQAPNLLELNTAEKVSEAFGVTTQTGAENAWVYQDGQRVFITNPSENEDQPARFDVTLSESLSIGLKGNISVHTLWMAVETEDAVEILLHGRQDAPQSLFELTAHEAIKVEINGQPAGSISPDKSYRLETESSQYPYRIRLVRPAAPDA